mmetsp:Transcript_27742/g.34475  ORF Transcript_27742/g.34475 Transcript_27742/m.34475 type:complete len:116 (+) Transcript_27742:749-1096(+)
MTLMNSSTTEESKSSIFSSVLSPPHTSNSSSHNGHSYLNSNNNQAMASSRVHEYHQQSVSNTMGGGRPSANQNLFFNKIKSDRDKNLLLSEQGYLNYVNKLQQPTSLTPNPKLFE